MRTTSIVRDGLVEVRLDSNRTSASAAEPVEVRLVVDAPAGTKVTMPIVGANLGGLNVTDRQLIRDLPIDREPTRRRWIFRFTVESIESGRFIIPAMEVLYRLPGDATGPTSQQSIRTKPLGIEIVSLLGDDPDPKAFRGIKGAVDTPELPSTRTHGGWIVLGFLISALVCLAGLLWWRRDRVPNPVQWASNEVSKINTLLEAQAISTNDAYAELSHVLRILLERETGIPATALSSRELKDELTAKSCPPPLIARLTQFLSDADEVKFSGRSRPRVSLTVSPTSSSRNRETNRSDVDRAAARGLSKHVPSPLVSGLVDIAARGRLADVVRATSAERFLQLCCIELGPSPELATAIAMAPADTSVPGGRSDDRLLGSPPDRPRQNGRLLGGDRD